MEGWGFEPQLTAKTYPPCQLPRDALPFKGARCRFRILHGKNN
nr:MAG TPA: hypothetical protein [Caudoviricetes sp.]